MTCRTVKRPLACFLLVFVAPTNVWSQIDALGIYGDPTVADPHSVPHYFSLFRVQTNDHQYDHAVGFGFDSTGTILRDRTSFGVFKGVIDRADNDLLGLYRSEGINHHLYVDITNAPNRLSGQAIHMGHDPTVTNDIEFAAATEPPQINLPAPEYKGRRSGYAQSYAPLSGTWEPEQGDIHWFSNGAKPWVWSVEFEFDPSGPARPVPVYVGGMLRMSDNAPSTHQPANPVLSMPRVALVIQSGIAGKIAHGFWIDPGTNPNSGGDLESIAFGPFSAEYLGPSDDLDRAVIRFENCIDQSLPMFEVNLVRNLPPTEPEEKK